MPKLIDMTGHVFGRLTVIGPAPQGVDGNGKAYHRWVCRCSCGQERIMRGAHIRRGTATSCGCYGTRHPISPATKSCWNGMVSRCTRPDAINYDRYGGRGIKVCERWLTSFENFLADMGPRPSPDHSVDRKDNDGDYEPGNCLWATRSDQARNRRSTRLVTMNGETKCLEAWAEATGIGYSTIGFRLRKGWSVERALTEPAIVGKNQSGAPR